MKIYSVEDRETGLRNCDRRSGITEKPFFMGTRELRTWVHGKGEIEDTVLRDANAFQERAHPSLTIISPSDLL